MSTIKCRWFYVGLFWTKVVDGERRNIELVVLCMWSLEKRYIHYCQQWQFLLHFCVYTLLLVKHLKENNISFRLWGLVGDDYHDYVLNAAGQLNTYWIVQNKSEYLIFHWMELAVYGLYCPRVHAAIMILSVKLNIQQLTFEWVIYDIHLSLGNYRAIKG